MRSLLSFIVFTLALLLVTGSVFAQEEPEPIPVEPVPGDAMPVFVLPTAIPVLPGDTDNVPAALSGIRDETAANMSTLVEDFDGFSPSFFSHDVMPTEIRVAITGYPDGRTWTAAGRPIKRVDTIPFRDYVKNVLPNEWVSSWPSDSLKAGAMAAKMFAWWRINVGPYGVYEGQPYDVLDNTFSQVYIANSARPSTDAAVDATWNTIMRRNGRVIEIHYVNTDANCQAWLPGTLCMGQWNSKYHADAGRDWLWILQHYYGPVEFTSQFPALPAHENLVKNPRFDTGNQNEWLFWGVENAVYTDSSYDNVLAIRKTGTDEYGSAYQYLNYPVPAGGGLAMDVLLGNNSATYGQDVTIVLRNRDVFSESRYCLFTIPPNTPLGVYGMRVKTPSAWLSGMSVEIGTKQTQSSLLIDNVRVQYTPGISVDMTECYSPSNTTSWDFHPGGPRGWMVDQAMSGEFLDEHGGVWYSVKGSDPRIEGPGMIGVNAADYPYLAIQWASRADECLKVYFTTGTQTAFTEQQSRTVMITPGFETRTDYIPMVENASWTGTINRLRIAPACGLGAGGGVRIDRIWLTDADYSEPPVDPGQPGIPKVPSPQGEALTMTVTFRWQHEASTEWYRVAVVNQGGIIYDDWFAATDAIAAQYGLSQQYPGVCNESVCEIPPQMRNWWFNNGQYTWWVGRWYAGLDVEDMQWQSTDFSLNLNPPGAIPVLHPTLSSGGHVQVHWVAINNAAWYEVWVGAADYSSTYHQRWYEDNHLCLGSICTVHFNAPSGDGEIWVRAWGPGGMSQGVPGGWNGPVQFTVP